MKQTLSFVLAFLLVVLVLTWTNPHVIIDSSDGNLYQPTGITFSASSGEQSGEGDVQPAPTKTVQHEKVGLLEKPIVDFDSDGSHDDADNKGTSRTSTVSSTNFFSRILSFFGFGGTYGGDGGASQDAPLNDGDGQDTEEKGEEQVPLPQAADLSAASIESMTYKVVEHDAFDSVVFSGTYKPGKDDENWQNRGANTEFWYHEFKKIVTAEPPYFERDMQGVAQQMDGTRQEHGGGVIHFLGNGKADHEDGVEHNLRHEPRYFQVWVVEKYVSKNPPYRSIDVLSQRRDVSSSHTDSGMKSLDFSGSGLNINFNK